MLKDLLSVASLEVSDLNELIELTTRLKKGRGSDCDKPLAGKSIGMIFAKSSTRTRVSFEVGINELGGYSMYLDQSKLQLGRGESISDTAQVLSRYLHAVIIRTHEHSSIEEFAKYSSIPVINALTDLYHPCQILTDLFTIYENAGTFEDVKVCFLGDGSCNMANSLILAAKLSGVELRISSPERFSPNLELGPDTGPDNVIWEPDPQIAIENADFVYTDVWVSMGCENEAAKRMKLLRPYQLNEDLLSMAGEDAKVLHCLPAHRGEEITDEVIDSPQSIVFDQAENRLHMQKAILSKMLG